MSMTTTSIESGLDFILSHLEEPAFPRRIWTYTTQKQILVNNRDEALAEFGQSNLLDCRISAYPYPVPEYKGVNRQTPGFFLSDLDKKNFKTDRLFQQCLESTYRTQGQITAQTLYIMVRRWLPSASTNACRYSFGNGERLCRVCRASRN